MIATGLQLFENLFPEIHPLNKLAANLSGVTLGGVMMVLAFLRDSRLDEERRCAKNAQEQAKSARQEAEAQRQRAEAERLRADRAEAELQRVLSQYQESDLMARVRRLEELYGTNTDAADNGTVE